MIATKFFSQYFRFQAFRSSLGLEPGNDTWIVLNSESTNNRQQFFLYPVPTKNSNYFIVINVETGKAWKIIQGHVEEKDIDYTDTSEMYFFSLEEEETGVGKFATIRRKNSTNVFGAKFKREETMQLIEYNLSQLTGSLDNKNFLLKDGNQFPHQALIVDGDLVALPPPLTEHAPPSPIVNPFVRRTVMLPFFLIKDPQHDSAWQVKNSPIYYLRRDVKFISENGWFIYNDTSSEQHRTWRTTIGWSETDSETFSETTGISASAGGSFFGIDLGAEVSEEFGYSNTHSFTETYTEEEEINLNCAPRASTVMWQSNSTYTLIRGDGSIAQKWIRNDDGLYYYELPIDQGNAKLFGFKRVSETTGQLLSLDGKEDVREVQIKSVPLENSTK